MPNRRLLGLISIVAIVAFAVMPVVGQARPHYYKTGGKVAEGVKVPVLAWGNLEYTAEGISTLECQQVVGGYVENPKGGTPGDGAIESFNAYNCKDVGCNASGDFESVQARNANGEHESSTEGPFGSGNQVKWPSLLEEKNPGTEPGVIRTNISNVSLFVACRESSGGLVPGFDVECFNDATHEQTPRVENGIGIGSKPSRLRWDVESGGLNCSGAYTGKIGKGLKLMGYNEQEIIETRE